jgi:hypothetical protein
MQHPVFYLARVTKFLDRLIQEQGGARVDVHPSPQTPRP